jgi:hypothetical protein
MVKSFVKIQISSSQFSICNLHPQTLSHHKYSLFSLYILFEQKKSLYPLSMYFLTYMHITQFLNVLNIIIFMQESLIYYYGDLKNHLKKNYNVCFFTIFFFYIDHGVNLD